MIVYKFLDLTDLSLILQGFQTNSNPLLESRKTEYTGITTILPLLSIVTVPDRYHVYLLLL